MKPSFHEVCRYYISYCLSIAYTVVRGCLELYGIFVKMFIIVLLVNNICHSTMPFFFVHLFHTYDCMIDYMIFQTIFNSILVESWQPVHLPILEKFSV